MGNLANTTLGRGFIEWENYTFTQDVVDMRHSRCLNQSATQTFGLGICPCHMWLANKYRGAHIIIVGYSYIRRLLFISLIWDHWYVHGTPPMLDREI